ncbi:MAG: cation-translocating P-type ATPase [Ruthenibacterium sp.]
MQTQKPGLTAQQAAQRLQQVGENRLREAKKNSIAAMFFSQFKDVLILILAVATVISVLMGQGTEAVTIIIIVLINATMGFVQEYRTEKTLAALKELSSPTARVRRDGRQSSLPAQELVPGDVILLRAGDKIPADAKLDFDVQVSCNESMLTGESLPVQKQPGDAMYMGCVMMTGRGEATVTATGMATEMGKIAGMMDETAEEPTPLQLRLRQLGKFVAVLCVSVCLAVGFLGFLQGGDFLTMLLTGVSLAVAAIPEGLPAIVTITLALSVNRILRRGAVIRKLHAVETLGCAGVICSDKTGTITQNSMTVQCVVTPENTPEAQRRLLRAAVLCCSASLGDHEASTATGDATELAILRAARQEGVRKETELLSWHVISEQPFDAVRKRMSVTVKRSYPAGQEHAQGKRGGEAARSFAAEKGAAERKTEQNGGAQMTMLICKGAPDLLLPLCTQVLTANGVQPMFPRQREKLQQDMAALAQHALRVIGVATSDTPHRGERELCFCGLIGMQDPPRPEVEPAVRRCRAAGIQPVMITGDSRDTALAVARSVGIARAGDKALDGTELDAMTDAQLAAVCMQTSVYARVSPAHKLRIVRAYKAAGQITAMTGDGVNDAPAVKEADIGIAMGLTGTDVTREASGVVILDDNFATIVAAVEEGRVIYQNILRFIRFLLASNLGEVLGMLFGMMLGLPVMLVPIQILLVNLFTDGLPAIALGLEPPDEGIMRQKPRPKTEGLFAHGLGGIIVIRGILLGMASCGAYGAVLHSGASLEIARSACFMTIVLSQMLHIFECRGTRVLHFGGNPALLLATLCSVLATLISVYLPAAQPLFGTAAVWGTHLIPVAVAALAGPVLTAIWRAIRRD